MSLPDRRPNPSNAPPRELAPAVVAVPVAITHGKWKLSMSPVAALVALVVCAFFGLGWFVHGARKAPAEDVTALVADVRQQLAEQKQAQADVRSTIIERLNGIETQVSRLQDSQDRLRERVNDRLNSRP